MSGDIESFIDPTQTAVESEESLYPYGIEFAGILPDGSAVIVARAFTVILRSCELERHIVFRRAQGKEKFSVVYKGLGRCMGESCEIQVPIALPDANEQSHLYMLETADEHGYLIGPNSFITHEFPAIDYEDLGIHSIHQLMQS
jgi:hypothetical protein